MNNDNLNNARRTLASSVSLRFFDFVNPQSSADLTKFGDNCIHSIQETPQIIEAQIWRHTPRLEVLPQLFDREIVELSTGFAKIYGGGNVR